MITISSGDDRRVIAIPHMNVVLKVARIHWWYALDFIIYAFKTHQPRGKLHEWWRHQIDESTTEHNSCLKRFLFGGICANWRERRFYKERPDLKILQPTYFSLLGFLNVQRYGIPIDDAESTSVYHAFYPIAGQDLIRDSHHWVHGPNFHLTPESRPKILDYGGTKTQMILTKYGNALHDRFDFAFGKAQSEYYAKKRRNQEE